MTFDVLVIDDSRPDRELLSLLFKSCPVPTRTHFAVDGVTGSDFIFKRGAQASAPTPHLILCDLNLPIKNGMRLLSEVRTEPKLCHIPFLLLTTSSDPQDVSEAYRIGASAFLTKPSDLELFQKTIDALALFWFKAAILPTVPVEQ